MPVFLRWCEWLCALKYASNLALITEFGDNCRQGYEEECDALLEQNDIKKDQWWLYVTILLALFLGFRTIAAISLYLRARG